MPRRIDSNDEDAAADASNAGAVQSAGVSRRKVLRRAAVVSGATVVGALAANLTESPPAVAATGNAVLAGEQTNAEGTTVLYADAPTPYAHGLLAVTDTPFNEFPQYVPQAAVLGFTGAADGVGVAGYGTSSGGAGVSGRGNVGVQGATNDGINQGYLGWTGNGGGGPYGVYGAGTVGVYGFGMTGPGVLAFSESGPALKVLGPAEFSRSGVATIAGTPAAPAGAVTVSGVTLNSTSLVLATIQQVVKGVAVQGVAKAPSAGRFTIHLTKPVKTNVVVAWFVIG